MKCLSMDLHFVFQKDPDVKGSTSGGLRKQHMSDADLSGNSGSNGGNDHDFHKLHRAGNFGHQGWML
jgi:hypothetical protein